MAIPEGKSFEFEDASHIRPDYLETFDFVQRIPARP